MKRILLIPVLTLAALLSVGCSYEGGAILSEVPGGYRGQSGVVPSGGKYALYHVTAYDKWGAPTETQIVKTVTLQEGEHVGFEYVLPPSKEYEADARSHVVAYAGTFHKDLGPIETLNDHYYWANPDDWDGFWASRPERVLLKRATMY